MTTRERILLEVRLWRMEKENLDKSYFKNLARSASPSMLWIESYGNAAPVHELINVEPGDVLVHRNVGGVCRVDDPNLVSTIDYFLEQNAAKHIVVCGHSQCQSIKELVTPTGNASLNNRWTEEIKELYDQHSGDLASLAARQKEKKLGELSVRRQVDNLARLDAVQAAWSKGRDIVILGLYLDVSKGEVQDLYSLSSRDLAAQFAART